jgi:membrane protein YqaA with SNARE-associated domain
VFDLLEWAQAFTLALGLPGVLVISLVSTSSLFFFPIADIFYIPWSVEVGLDATLVGLVWGFGAGVGEMVAYAVGRLSKNVVSMRRRMIKTRKGIPAHTVYFTVGRRIKRHTEPEDWTTRYGFWAIPIFAFTPLPMDLLGIAMGYLRYNSLKFFLGVLIGKLPRSLLMAYGLRFFHIPLWLIVLLVALSGLVVLITRRIRV